MSKIDYAICLLAGGQARRMGGGDKGELVIDGQTLLSHLIGRFEKAPYLFLNANGDLSRFAHYGLDVVPDILPDHQGPLSGIYAGLSHLAAKRAHCKWLVTLPIDAPLVPESIAQDMIAHATSTDSQLVSVKSAGRTHPVIGLWFMAALPALQSALIDDGVRKIDAFTESFGVTYLTYEGEPDPFLNLNRPDDLTAYQAIVAQSAKHR